MQSSPHCQAIVTTTGNLTQQPHTPNNARGYICQNSLDDLLNMIIQALEVIWPVDVCTRICLLTNFFSNRCRDRSKAIRPSHAHAYISLTSKPQLTSLRIRYLLSAWYLDSHIHPDSQAPILVPHLQTMIPTSLIVHSKWICGNLGTFFTRNARYRSQFHVQVY